MAVVTNWKYRVNGLKMSGQEFRKRKAFYYETYTCEFPLRLSPSGEINCGEQAAYYGWWGDEYYKGWWLCKKHWRRIKEKKEKICRDCWYFEPSHQGVGTCLYHNFDTLEIQSCEDFLDATSFTASLCEEI